MNILGRVSHQKGKARGWLVKYERGLWFRGLCCINVDFLIWPSVYASYIGVFFLGRAYTKVLRGKGESCPKLALKCFIKTLNKNGRGV